MFGGQHLKSAPVFVAQLNVKSSEDFCQPTALRQWDRTRRQDRSKVFPGLVRDLDLYIMQIIELIQSNRDKTRLKAKSVEDDGGEWRRLGKRLCSFATTG